MSRVSHEVRNRLKAPRVYMNDYIKARPETKPPICLKLVASDTPISIRAVQNHDAARRRKTKVTLPTIKFGDPK